MFQLQQQFVGVEHFISLIRVLGRANLPLLVGECLENLNLKVLPPLFADTCLAPF